MRGENERRLKLRALRAFWLLECPLSVQESAVLARLAEGATYRQVGRELGGGPWQVFRVVEEVARRVDVAADRRTGGVRGDTEEALVPSR